MKPDFISSIKTGTLFILGEVYVRGKYYALEIRRFSFTKFWDCIFQQNPVFIDKQLSSKISFEERHDIVAVENYHTVEEFRVVRINMLETGVLEGWFSSGAPRYDNCITIGRD